MATMTPAVVPVATMTPAVVPVATENGCYDDPACYDAGYYDWPPSSATMRSA